MCVGGVGVGGRKIKAGQTTQSGACGAPRHAGGEVIDCTMMTTSMAHCTWLHVAAQQRKDSSKCKCSNANPDTLLLPHTLRHVRHACCCCSPMKRTMAGCWLSCARARTSFTTNQTPASASAPVASAPVASADEPDDDAAVPVLTTTSPLPTSPLKPLLPALSASGSRRDAADERSELCVWRGQGGVAPGRGVAVIAAAVLQSKTAFAAGDMCCKSALSCGGALPHGEGRQVHRCG